MFFPEQLLWTLGGGSSFCSHLTSPGIEDVSYEWAREKMIRALILFLACCGWAEHSPASVLLCVEAGWRKEASDFSTTPTSLVGAWEESAVFLAISTWSGDSVSWAGGGEGLRKSRRKWDVAQYADSQCTYQTSVVSWINVSSFIFSIPLGQFPET